MSTDMFCTNLKTYLMHYSADTLELEWRMGRQLPHAFVPGVSKRVFERCRSMLCASKSFERSCSDTTEQLAADHLKYVVDNVTKAGHWCKKTREFVHDTATVRMAVSSEVFHGLGQPAGPFTGTRHKSRESFVHKCWRFDLTRVKSNHHDDLDNDDEIFEVELELADRTALFVYTLDHLLAWGTALLEGLMSHGE